MRDSFEHLPKGAVIGWGEAPVSPFLSDAAKSEIAAKGRQYTANQYLEAAQACVDDGEIEVVRKYFLEQGLVYPGQLEDLPD